jgi:hypothetical protein
MPEQTVGIFQFRITLEHIKPPIWRRIQVPGTYSFWDLHVAIQDAMGWTDTHLHGFRVVNPGSKKPEEIGIPDEDFPDSRVLPGWERKIASYFLKEKDTASYTYDYGDDWVHSIKLEKILPKKEGVKYPVCVKGARACPPEDSGGPFGYPDFLDAVTDPSHEEHEDVLDWLGGEFDPEEFDPAEVFFDDPEERWQSRLV